MQLPRVYAAEAPDLPIFEKLITWFWPYLTSLGQLLLYRWRIKPKERKVAEAGCFRKQIIQLLDG